MAGGLVLVAMGFWLGISSPSATVAGRSHDCQMAFPISWLGSGIASGPRSGDEPMTSHARRAQEACAVAERTVRNVAWTSLALGFVLGVGGWTVLRDREEPLPPRPQVKVL